GAVVIERRSVIRRKSHQEIPPGAVRAVEVEEMDSRGRHKLVLVLTDGSREQICFYFRRTAAAKAAKALVDCLTTTTSEAARTDPPRRRRPARAIGADGGRSRASRVFALDDDRVGSSGLADE